VFRRGAFPAGKADRHIATGPRCSDAAARLPAVRALLARLLAPALVRAARPLLALARALALPLDALALALALAAALALLAATRLALAVARPPLERPLRLRPGHARPAGLAAAGEASA